MVFPVNILKPECGNHMPSALFSFRVKLWQCREVEIIRREFTHVMFYLNNGIKAYVVHFLMNEKEFLEECYLCDWILMKIAFMICFKVKKIILVDLGLVAILNDSEGDSANKVLLKYFWGGWKTYMFLSYRSAPENDENNVISRVAVSLKIERLYLKVKYFTEIPEQHK